MGVPQDRERRPQVRVVREGMDEADPGTPARERAAQTGDGRRGTTGDIGFFSSQYFLIGEGKIV